MTLEKKLCCLIMLCQMTAILSGVSMLYLAVIVIIPSKTELTMGIGVAPIMCSTIFTNNINLQVNPDNTPKKCDWASCREWCLSKDPTRCLQITARPRIKGAHVTVENCEVAAVDEQCSALDIQNSEPIRCMKGECKDLDGLYNCTRGLDTNQCYYLDPAYECSPAGNLSRTPIICTDKCEKSLIGVVACNDGECLTLYDFPTYLKCRRKCTDLQIRKKNTVIFSKERIVARQCSRIETSNGTHEMRTLSERQGWIRGDEVLMLFCTYITETETGYEMDDCFNATLGSAARLSTMRRYEDFLDFHLTSSNKNGYLIDPEETLQIMNDTKLFFNSEACSNTLSKKCTEFYSTHTHDQRDGRTRHRYPCYYTMQHNDFVTTYYDPDETKMYLAIAIAVPLGLFILSCAFLYICSKLVNTDDDGHLALKSFKKDPIPSDASDL